MASIIEGYNYDIFISYRQKDNKHDGWVTEFVRNLKDELESTFKEEISVYFDINPHDGLLETHDVDASLKEKLKCLIFIPVISRTYCDPKSFAWEHEFKAFVEMASKDQFGLKVKLPNGNVAGRVLPIQIHNIDPEDRKCLEEVLGGHIRGVDFIYKEPGVDRPLKPEDREEKNLAATKYNNQINKVSNAIRELLTAVKKYSLKSLPVNDLAPEPARLQKRKPGVKRIVLFSVLVFIAALMYFLFNPLHHREETEKSIAVLPFELLSDEPDKQYLADGMMESIILHLSRIKDLHVVPGTSMERYRNSTKKSPQIGRELNVEYLVHGSYQKYGEKTRLIIHLIKAKDDREKWANDYEKTWKDIFLLQSEVARDIAAKLNAEISPEENNLISRKPTLNLTAYDLYMKGRESDKEGLNTSIEITIEDTLSLRKARKYYYEAIRADPSFAPAYASLAVIFLKENLYSDSYFSKNYLDSTRILAQEALRLDPSLSEAHDVLAEYYYSCGEEELAVAEFEKSLKYNPNNWNAYLSRADCLADHDPSQSLIAYNEALTRIKERRIIPDLLRRMSMIYSSNGFREKAIECVDNAYRQDSNLTLFFEMMGTIECYCGAYKNSLDYYNKLYAIDSSFLSALNGLGFVYQIIGDYNQSLQYYKKYTHKIDTIGKIKINEAQRIGYAYWKNGFTREADEFFRRQLEYSNKSIEYGRAYGRSWGAYFDLAGVYSFYGERELAMKNLLKINVKEMNPYIFVWFMKRDPLLENIREDPEFKRILNDAEVRQDALHEKMRKWLEENKML